VTIRLEVSTPYSPASLNYFTGGAVSIRVDDQSTGLTSGSFALAPGESVELSWTTAPTSFLAVGK